MTKKIILSLTGLFLCATFALAQGKQYIGYCDGQIASSSSGKYTSIGETGSTISLAIRLTKETLAAYQGCNIVGVNYGFPTSQGLGTVTVWVRTSLDAEPLATGKITNTNYGWHEGSIEPYTITGQEKELWIGATYKNDTRAYYAVSFAGTAVPDGCYVCADKTTWTNYASQGWGSLSLEAVVEGAGVKSRDLALLNVAAGQRAVQIGQDFDVSGIIKNNASDVASNPVIRYSINGQPVGSYTYNGDVASRASVPFTLTIPTASITTEGTADVSLSLEWSDGQPDQAPADNVASVQVEMTRLSFTRRMVVEEHTGSWCGWCVRGIVGLKEMKEKYGDDFIGIGIHNEDMYAVEAYDNFIAGYMSGYPNSIINRSGSACDPSYSNLAGRWLKMDKTADADITLDASCADGKITFNAHSQFVFNATDADYRVAFVLLENQLPIRQTNYYAGGTVMGGFESMGSPANINIDDVARGIYPSPAGEKGALPAIIKAGTIYDYSYTTALPKLATPANVEAVALLLNGATGEILNAIKISQIEGLNAGDIDDPDGPVADLSCTLSPATGATVNTLDKVILTFHGKDAEAGMNHVGYYNYLAPNYGAPSVEISSRPYLRDAAGKTVAKASRVMWTLNPNYGKVAGADPYNINEFQLSFDGVPAGQYTLVVPQNSFVYYNSREELCTTPEYTAQYTVSNASPALLGHYDARFQPAQYSELEQWDIVTLNSNDAIFDYLHTDLPLVYNYFYIDTPRRPYVILPNGVEQEAKYVDFVETTGVSTVGTQIQFTFSTSRTRGTYTLVIPDGYIVQGNDATEEAYAQPERRFTFFVGQAPEGIAPLSTVNCPLGDARRRLPEQELSTPYDLTGRSLINPDGLYISNGRKHIYRTK